MWDAQIFQHFFHTLLIQDLRKNATQRFKKVNMLPGLIFLNTWMYFSGCSVVCRNGSQELYNGCIIAVHAPDALRMLRSQATFDETRVLGAFQYVYRYNIFHYHLKIFFFIVWRILQKRWTAESDIKIANSFNLLAVIFTFIVTKVLCPKTQQHGVLGTFLEVQTEKSA